MLTQNELWLYRYHRNLFTRRPHLEDELWQNTQVKRCTLFLLHPAGPEHWQEQQWTINQIQRTQDSQSWIHTSGFAALILLLVRRVLEKRITIKDLQKQDKIERTIEKPFFKKGWSRQWETNGEKINEKTQFPESSIINTKTPLFAISLSLSTKKKCKLMLAEKVSYILFPVR